MPKPPKTFNPFYVLLVIAGAVFVVTTFAYSLVAFAVSQSNAAPTSTLESHPLFAYIRTQGDQLLLMQVALLSVLTFGAIGTDSFWQRRAQRLGETGQHTAGRAGEAEGSASSGKT